ncbi:hypothetical protein WJ47_12940 [Burkholderia ubonensis]|uniref:Uncharacterized protein n=1 Tax=Burkholderia ubonensis TaxID=101571 RepID=A0AB73FSQ6_9BURK|nr:hypothetical protein WJ44_33420 [Burkholderia ubonensis]KVL66251.1 hypothetical protein WJ47_12940 [Burkholderia ubonensis]KVM19983.1 hypothetical protein WJ53_23005 [Burkholderia ubonensis]KVM26870.1 hypothetical protein WJ54_16625 [Burkholderia ubonensis]
MHDYFEALYVHSFEQERSVQFAAGNHPVTTRGADGSFSIEGGAALVVSQDGTAGHVAVFIYPYERQTDGRSRPFLWDLFDSPEDLTNERLDRAIRDFAICCRASSVVDATKHPLDPLRLSWVKCRAWQRGVRLKYGLAAPRRNRRSWLRSAMIGIGLAIGGVAWLLNVPSQIATLWGVTVPQLWTRLTTRDTAPAKPAPGPASAPPPSAAPARPNSSSAAAPVLVSQPLPTIPVIRGWYTFCPTDSPAQADRKLLNFLYDVRQAAGSIAFFDVQIDVDCVMGRAPSDNTGNDAIISRTADQNSVNYTFQVTWIPKNEQRVGGPWLSGNRSFAQLVDRFADNGSTITVHDDATGRNAFTRLTVNAEGADDIIYGPYQIKAGGQDAFLTLDLTPPTLDSAQQTAVATLDRQIRQQSDPGTAAAATTMPQTVKLKRQAARSDAR